MRTPVSGQHWKRLPRTERGKRGLVNPGTAKIVGTTSRMLRHHDGIGLLALPTGQNGYRYYDCAALVQLQRILLLRGLGLGLPATSEARN